MEKRALGNSGIETSVIAFGAWQIGGPPFWEETEEKTAIEAVNKSLESGINFFDTAAVYGMGRSEELLGKALKEARDRVYIATKCGLRWSGDGKIYNDLSPGSIREEAEASLKRLGTDYIDLYQIHWPSPKHPVEPAMEEMARLKEEGKIKAIGVSNFDVPLLEKARSVAEVSSVQPVYNILDRDAENELLPYCRENNIGVLAYSPLASGLLSGKYDANSSFNDWRGAGVFGIFRPERLGPALEKLEKLKSIAADAQVPLPHLAINWVLANPAVTSALVGVKTPGQMENNVECLGKPLTGEVKERVDRIK